MVVAAECCCDGIGFYVGGGRGDCDGFVGAHDAKSGYVGVDDWFCTVVGWFPQKQEGIDGYISAEADMKASFVKYPTPAAIINTHRCCFSACTALSSVHLQCVFNLKEHLTTVITINRNKV
mmetsp:Transcript_23724/g.55286  ORF Transcript_23724/g.55286 Transcript_23724/m.55286 type:complete len:121 (+) Transcript_23724:671-1033(+)